MEHCESGRAHIEGVKVGSAVSACKERGSFPGSLEVSRSVHCEVRHGVCASRSIRNDRTENSSLVTSPRLFTFYPVTISMSKVRVSLWKSALTSVLSNTQNSAL